MEDDQVSFGVDSRIFHHHDRRFVRLGRIGGAKALKVVTADQSPGRLFHSRRV